MSFSLPIQLCPPLILYIEGSQPECCISTIYHAWDTPFCVSLSHWLPCLPAFCFFPVFFSFIEIGYNGRCDCTHANSDCSVFRLFNFHNSFVGCCFVFVVFLSSALGWLYKMRAGYIFFSLLESNFIALTSLIYVAEIVFCCCDRFKQDIDGGLHPAVDGQSLDEDKDLNICIATI